MITHPTYINSRGPILVGDTVRFDIEDGDGRRLPEDGTVVAVTDTTVTVEVEGVDRHTLATSVPWFLSR